MASFSLLLPRRKSPLSASLWDRWGAQCNDTPNPCNPAWPFDFLHRQRKTWLLLCCREIRSQNLLFVMWKRGGGLPAFRFYGHSRLPPRERETQKAIRSQALPPLQSTAQRLFLRRRSRCSCRW